LALSGGYLGSQVSGNTARGLQGASRVVSSEVLIDVSAGRRRCGVVPVRTNGQLWKAYVLRRFWHRVFDDILASRTAAGITAFNLVLRQIVLLGFLLLLFFEIRGVSPKELT